MLISDTAIKRPVFSVALSLIIIIVGLLSYMNLSLQQYPDVEEPILTIQTFYPGASSTIVESKITTILEDALSGISSLDYMESSSKTGKSDITLYFRGGTVLSDAASDIRERLAQVGDALPDEADEPKVLKTSAAQDAFMYIMLISPQHDELALNDYAVRNLKSPFESLPGVGGVTIYGNDLTMQVRLDREKLKGYGLAVTDLLYTLEESSQIMPAGTIIKGKRHVSVIAEAGLNTPEEMGEMVVSTAQGHILHLKDVATITLGKDTGERQWMPRYNKKPAVFIAIKKASGGNILTISNTVKKLLESLKDDLPQGMELDVGYNFSMFIEASIKAVEVTIFEAIVLVLLIILFFLHSVRASLIPVLTIPVSLIGSFVFLYMFQCSLNTITLLAMVLAIGLVVDDAIVVLENIHRHIEEGLAPIDAAFKGAHEVGFAVIAMTLTLASVYAPIAFVQGLTGKLFAEFAVSLAGAVLISGLVALTLTPMMCSKLLRPKTQEKHNRLSKVIEGLIAHLESGYQRALRTVLSFPKVLCGLLLLVFVGGGYLFTRIPSELAPQEDQGIIFSAVEGEEGATFDSMAVYVPTLEDMLTSVPEYRGVFSVTERSGIFGGITLAPWGTRTRSQSDIIADLRQKAKKIAGAQVYVFPMKGLLTGGQAGLQMAFKTTGTYADLEKDMDKLVKKLKTSPCFDTVSHDLSLGTPQISVQIDRNKAALLGVKVIDVARTLEVMLSGDRSTTFEKDGRHYEVIVQAREEHKKDLSDLGNFYVKSTAGAKDTEDLIPLSNVISVKEIAVPSTLKHLNKMRAAILNAELVPSCRTEEALAILKTTVKEMMPPAIQTEPVGNLRKYMESQGEMYLIFCASLLFIYLVLAIQFESLLDPLLIMITVPLSMGGALLALYVTGGTLNVFSQVGLITLVGLITKHGILIVEFANKQRSHGGAVGARRHL